MYVLTSRVGSMAFLANIALSFQPFKLRPMFVRKAMEPTLDVSTYIQVAFGLTCKH